MYGLCQLLPPAPRPEFLTPVSSDIPTMVVYGLNDTQTSSVDARHAAETLSRAQVIEVPEAGHGAIIFSQCVKDIGMAFFERPENSAGYRLPCRPEAEVRAAAQLRGRIPHTTTICADKSTTPSPLGQHEISLAV